MGVSAREIFEDGFIDPADRDGIERYAKAFGFIPGDASLVSVTKAGEGNMNLTLRLTTDRGSVILKQSRPWVEKYPQIPAPPERALVEIAFYEHARSRPELAAAMPRLIGSDPDGRVLVLEDLGEAHDFTPLYRGEHLTEPDLEALIAYLVALHEPWTKTPGVFANRAMRALNHEHIFVLPLEEDNGLDLEGFTPGLADAARALTEDRAYVARVRALGEHYLEDGGVLAHGDYFPGSWLRTSDGVRVIDPEFCFIGPAAFDLGFMLGHLYLASEPETTAARALELYGGSSEIESLARQFAGVEIMRRLIGVAQLDTDLNLEAKTALLERSRELVLAS